MRKVFVVVLGKTFPSESTTFSENRTSGTKVTENPTRCKEIISDADTFRNFHRKT